MFQIAKKKFPIAILLGGLSVNLNHLKTIYTNHSLRATSISIFTDVNFSNADIMSVSGYKSVQSLAVYQKTSESKKIEMGKVITGSLTPKLHQKAILPPQPKKYLESSKSERAAAPKENVTE